MEEGYPWLYYWSNACFESPYLFCEIIALRIIGYNDAADQGEFMYSM
jgi:hypothetical protein